METLHELLKKGMEASDGHEVSVSKNYRNLQNLNEISSVTVNVLPCFGFKCTFTIRLMEKGISIQFFSCKYENHKLHTFPLKDMKKSRKEISLYYEMIKTIIIDWMKEDSKMRLVYVFEGDACIKEDPIISSLQRKVSDGFGNFVR